VFDDAALGKYKNDPRVHFVPGHPVLRDAMPELQKGMGVKIPGTIVEKAQQWQRWGMHNLKYGTPMRKAKTVLGPLAIAAAALGAVGAGVLLVDKLAGNARSRSRAGRIKQMMENYL
jgi:hypothetical protein